MHLMQLRCTFGFHDWYPVANEKDGYESRVCARCDRRQWRIERDSDTAWINGRLPETLANPWTPGIPKPPQGGTGVQKPQRSVESFQVVCERDPGLWPEEQGKP